MKTLTLFFCAVATSTVFWTSPASESPSDGETKTSEQKKTEPELNSWGLDADDPHFIVKFYQECEVRKRAANGNYAEIYRYLCRELERTDIREDYRIALKYAKYNTAVLMPGQPPIDALYHFAEKNWDDPQLFNGQAWEIAERGINGEQIPEKLVAAAIYLAERAVELDPNRASAFDTLSHLYEMQGRTNMAIHAAELAAKYAKDASSVKFKQRLRDLQ